jgi:hypothetical protein
MVINNVKDREIIPVREITTKIVKDKTIVETIEAMIETEIEKETMGIMDQIAQVTQREVETRRVVLFKNLLNFLWVVYRNH